MPATHSTIQPVILSLGATYSYTLVPATTKNISQITVTSWLDSPSHQTISLQTKEIGKVILWSGASYSQMTNWTKTQAQNRLIQIIKNNI